MLAVRRVEAQALCAWPCGHPRTEANSYRAGKNRWRCAECHRAGMRQRNAERYRRKSREQRAADYLAARRRMLPDVYARAVLRLETVRKEAARLGVAL